MTNAQKRVKAADLKPGMVIHEICDLSYKFSTLDSKQINFLKLNFKGSSACILEGQEERTIPIEDLKELDHLKSIKEIPETLKVARVVAGAGTLFQQKGLLEFVITIPQTGTSGGEATTGIPSAAPGLSIDKEGAHAQHKEKVQAARQFLDSIETASSHRVRASDMVQELLDQGRTGKFSSKGVEGVIDDLLKKGSTPAMKAIAGLRGSDQTYAHCTDMSVILQNCYIDMLRKMGREPTLQVSRFALLSGFLHDIGKSEVSKDILESSQRFSPDSNEMLILRNHTTYGAKILSDMGMHETIINVAHLHHVKKDSTLLSSYPDIPYEQVKPMTRLASIVDVYQALIGRRSYKKNWVPGKAVEFILSLEESEFDKAALNHFLTSIGRFPLGSLLRLSTGYLAFVIALAPQNQPERPLVATIENPSGELTSHHQVVDLMLEEDISVVEVIDHYEHFSESDDQAYDIFRSIRI